MYNISEAGFTKSAKDCPHADRCIEKVVGRNEHKFNN